MWFSFSGVETSVSLIAKDGECVTLSGIGWSCFVSYGNNGGESGRENWMGI